MVFAQARPGCKQFVGFEKIKINIIQIACRYYFINYGKYCWYILFSFVDYNFLKFI